MHDSKVGRNNVSKQGLYKSCILEDGLSWHNIKTTSDVWDMSRLKTKAIKWSVYPPSLIRVFAVRMKKHWSSATHWPHCGDTDQTGRMPRLIWVFAGRTCHFVGFVMSWLNNFKKLWHMSWCLTKPESPNLSYDGSKHGSATINDHNPLTAPRGKVVKRKTTKPDSQHKDQLPPSLVR